MATPPTEKLTIPQIYDIYDAAIKSVRDIAKKNNITSEQLNEAEEGAERWRDEMIDDAKKRGTGGDAKSWEKS